MDEAQRTDVVGTQGPLANGDDLMKTPSASKSAPRAITEAPRNVVASAPRILVQGFVLMAGSQAAATPAEFAAGRKASDG